MPSEIQKVLWVVKKVGKSIKDDIEFYVENRHETFDEIWAWVKRNKWTLLVFAGILVIIIPLTVGFGPASVAAGSIAAAWQLGVGAVAAGSAFAVLQSLTMTGVFIGVRASMIGLGGFQNMFGSFKSPSPPYPPYPPEFFRKTPREAAGSSFALGSAYTRPLRGVEFSRPPRSPKADDTMQDDACAPLLRWLLGGSEPPFSPEEAGITSGDTRTIMLRYLAGDPKLPCLLRDAGITPEEGDIIWEVLAEIAIETLYSNDYLL